MKNFDNQADFIAQPNQDWSLIIQYSIGKHHLQPILTGYS
jgi:hypothetical protein